MENVIVVKNLTKTFKKRVERRFIFSNKYILVSALNNVSFDVKEKESVAIIGRNGSGKSTLFKILLGIYSQTSGNVLITKNINGILDSGLGFHKDLSGYDNILILGKLLGLSLKKIRRKIDEIVEFAELQNYIYTPLKHYSNGMISRLSFSIVRLSEADILLFDEVLAFGDIHFQQKAFQYLKKQTIEGKTFLIISHNIMGLIPVCNRFILLDKGAIVADGPSYYVLPIYYDSLANVVYNSTIKEEAFKQKALPFSLGGFQVDDLNLEYGQNEAYVEIKYSMYDFSANAIDVGFVVRDIAEQTITAFSLEKNNISLDPDSRTIVFQIPLKFFNLKYILLYLFIFNKTNGEFRITSEPIVVKINNTIESSELLNLYKHIGWVNLPVGIEVK